MRWKLIIQLDRLAGMRERRRGAAGRRGASPGRSPAHVGQFTWPRESERERGGGAAPAGAGERRLVRSCTCVYLPGVLSPRCCGHRKEGLGCCLLRISPVRNTGGVRRTPDTASALRNDRTPLLTCEQKKTDFGY